MIAAWMMFSILVGCALTAAAAAADRFAFLSRRPRRFIWLTALVATACWPVASIIRSALFAVRDSGTSATPLTGGVHRLIVLAVATRKWDIPPRWSMGLVVVWALVSAVLLARLALAVRYFQWRRATWPVTEIDGVGVHLAPDAGPAVIGLHPMQVVLPEWVLELERPLRSLILRHEAEHRAARDPYLLLVGSLLTALVPWNLPLWFQSRRLRLAIEIDCDARVLRAHPRWHQYALLLLTIAQRRTASTHRLAPAISEPTSNLERRITAMRMTPTLSRFHALCLGVAAVAAFALACAVDKPQSPDRSKQTPAVASQAAVVESAQSRDPASRPFFEFQVDKPVTPRTDLHVQYPAAMRNSGVTGEVWAQFVVDQTGRVDMATFKVLKSADPQFTAAVQAALPTWRLEPAVIHGKKVSQLVQQAFVFGQTTGA